MATSLPAPTYASPGYSSASNLRRQVLNFVSAAADDGDLDELANEAINGAIDRINNRTWNQIVGFMDFPLTVDVADYPVPLDFKKPLHFHLLDPDGNPFRRLEYLASKNLEDVFQRSVQSGNTCYYTFFEASRLVSLEPKPSAAILSESPTARLRFFRRIPHVHRSASSMVLAPREFATWIKWEARADIASVRAPQKFSMAERKSGQLWHELGVEDAKVLTDWIGEATNV